MKLNRFALILSCIMFYTFLFQSGCEEQNRRDESLDPDWFNQPVWQQIRTNSPQTAMQPVQSPVNNPVVNNIAPQISFAATSHDFGKIRSSTTNVCEFAFKNTGNDKLIISDVQSSCSCTPAFIEKDKKVYAPGESGRIFAGYNDTQLGQAIKHVYVSSNDPVNPRVEIAITADIVAPIDYEPKKLNLSLIGRNAECPKIVVTSSDGQPFAITGFKSTGGCITANFNPNVKATRFELEPQVDMRKLSSVPEGGFQIDISHPDCKVISGTYYTPPRFSASPRNITINQADPRNSVIKTVNIVSNYDEPFTIQSSATSGKRIINIIDTQKTRNGYQLTVQINPPVQDNNAKMFSDTIKINISGMETIEIACNGYYPGATPLSGQDKECKTCGGVTIDNPTMNPGYKKPG
jgi:hypothetical protein